MATHCLTEELQNEIRLIREVAVRLRATISSPSLRRRLDHALMEVDTFPRRYDSEELIREALARPIAWIRNVREAVETFGPDVQISARSPRVDLPQQPAGKVHKARIAAVAKEE